MAKYHDIPSKLDLGQSVLKFLSEGSPQRLPDIVNFVANDLCVSKTALSHVYPYNYNKAGTQIFYHHVQMALTALKNCKKIMNNNKGLWWKI